MDLFLFYLANIAVYDQEVIEVMMRYVLLTVEYLSLSFKYSFHAKIHSKCNRM